MRNFRRPVQLGAATLLALIMTSLGAIAGASTSDVRSQPNGDIRVIVSTGCQGTNRDGDNDLNTCTNGDNMSLFYSVGNQSDVTQTITIDYVLDGPGTEFDRAFTHEVVLEPNDFVQDLDGIRVQNKKTPLGEYTLTVTGSGSETVGTSAFVTVLRKNE